MEMAQDRPKTAQDGPKMAQRWPQDGPKTAQDGLRRPKESLCETSPVRAVRELGHNAGTGALSTWTLNSRTLGKTCPPKFEGSGAENAFEACSNDPAKRL